MADILRTDICIVGAGALGTRLAIGARQRGLTIVLVNRGFEEPGDPLQGSLQRTALAASAAQIEAFRNAARLGLENGIPKINFKVIVEHIAAQGAMAHADTSAERLTALGVQIITGDPRFLDRQTLRVGDTLLRPGHCILVTGSNPAVPELPGLADIPFFTPDTILAVTRKLSHLLVIGGGPKALELAQAFRRLGSDVTLVSQGPLLAGYDAEATAVLLRHLRDEGLAVIQDASVTTVVPRSQGIGVVLSDGSDHRSTLDISHVLIATDRVPDLDWTTSDKFKLKREARRVTHLQRNDLGRTSQWWISAFGGAGGDENPHLALYRGERLLDRLAGRPIGNSGKRLPMLVATEPALAQIGVLDDATKPRQGTTVLRANLAENEAARALGLSSGSAKLVVDRRGAIMGGAMVGVGAGEAIGSLALAMDHGITADELARLPLAGSSALAVLKEIGSQFAAQRPASNWSKRRASIRRFLP